MKIDRTKFENAKSYIDEINRKNLFSLDLSEFFDGEAEPLAEMLQKFTLTGLNNADLLTSDFYTKFNVHLRAPTSNKRGQE